MKNIIELKQARLAAGDDAKVILDRAEKERRELTQEEQKQYRELSGSMDELNHQILDAEMEEARAAEEAKRAFRAGNGGVVYDPHSRGDDYEIGEVLRPDQSVREYMQTRGLIRQTESSPRLGALMRAMMTGPRTKEERAALAEGADATGGFSVPDITMTRFVDKLRAALVCVRAGAQTVPLTSDKTTLARTATDPVAAWRAEAGAITESEPTFEGIVFVPRSLDVIIKASREVVEDSVNIVDALEAAIVGSMAVEVDRVCLVGSGTPPEPKGISNTTNVGAVAAGGALASYDKILDAVYEILVDNGPMPTAMMMPPRTLIALAKLKAATTNEPLPVPPLLANIPMMQTTGLPITESPGTASRLIMGDFSQLYIGIRTSLRIEVLRELYAANYQFGYLAHLRMDVGLAHPESFAQVTGIVP